MSTHDGERNLLESTTVKSGNEALEVNTRARRLPTALTLENFDGETRTSHLYIISWIVWIVLALPLHAPEAKTIAEL